MENELLTLVELSQALRLPRLWLRAEAEAGRIPALYIGRRFRFSLNAVKAALVAQAGASTLSTPRGPTDAA
jgi:excisionase family DNA binding protein